MVRPLLRWIPFVVGCIIALWIFTPLLSSSSNYGPRSHSFFGGFSRKPFHHPFHRPSSPHGDRNPFSSSRWADKADRVREAFVHAWSGYQKYAAGYDELLPVGVPGRVNNFNGWGVTLFDSLDTMWLMGLHDTFRASLAAVAKCTFSLTPVSFAPFFETVIRYLGGLLSAYALSGEPILLARADDLGRMLLPAFNTSSGLPMYAVNTVTGKVKPGWNNDRVLWAEALSNQMEFKFLAHITGRGIYFNKTESIMSKMYEADIKDGLFPTMWNMSDGTPSNDHHSVGAYADSAHEYLLKQWLLTGNSEPKTLELYLKSVSGILSKLLYITPNRKLLYATDLINGHPTHKLEHLSCFLPGLLALGAYALRDILSAHDKELHSWAANGLAETCWATYLDSKTGLGPDVMQMVSVGDGELWVDSLKKWEDAGRAGYPPGTAEVTKIARQNRRDYVAIKDSYLLRPETVESFYILWRTTGDERWRRRGWSIFESIEKHARTNFGYASVSGVDELPAQHKNEMPSYFMAETLKYLFLLFTDEDLLPLNDWVFNTEAHPLPVFYWRTWEKEEYGIL